MVQRAMRVHRGNKPLGAVELKRAVTSRMRTQAGMWRSFEAHISPYRVRFDAFARHPVPKRGPFCLSQRGVLLVWTTGQVMDLKMDHKRGYVAKSRIPHSRSLALEQRNKPTAGQVMVSLRGQELRRITRSWRRSLLLDELCGNWRRVPLQLALIAARFWRSSAPWRRRAW